VLREGEDWERVKLGRFNDADERLVRGVMGPWFLRPRRSVTPLKSKGSSNRTKAQERQAQVQLSRANTVALGLNYTPRKQALVKVGHCPMSCRGTMKQVCYIARVRPQDKREQQYNSVPLWDGFGAVLTDEDALSIAKRWDLASDKDNLSKTARTLLKQGDHDAFRALGERQKLRNIQTWHFILSIEENGDGVFEPFRAAVRRTVDTAFTAEGHQVIWTIHADDTEHLHAHVIVKALSEFGGRIHSDIRGDYLHHLRETFAGKLQREQLDYEATRRVDRKPLRDQIMAGQAPLNETIIPGSGGGGVRSPYANLLNWPQAFGRAAVENVKWMDAVRSQVISETHNLNRPERISRAAQLLGKHLDPAPRKPRRWKISLPWKKSGAANEDLPQAEQRFLERLEALYHNPKQALESWRLMASDGAFRSKNGKVIYPHRALAAWTLRHRPELFGLVNSKAFQNNPMRGLKKTLGQIRLWKPERLPGRAKNDNAFSEFRKNSRITKNRQAVLCELRALHTRVESAWPGTWWSRSLALAIRQAKRVRIDERAPNFEASKIGLSNPAGAAKRGPTERKATGGERRDVPQQQQPIQSPPNQNERKTMRSQNRRDFER